MNICRLNYISPTKPRSILFGRPHSFCQLAPLMLY